MGISKHLAPPLLLASPSWLCALPIRPPPHPGLSRRRPKPLEGPQGRHWIYGETGADPAFQGGRKERDHAGHIGFSP